MAITRTGILGIHSKKYTDDHKAYCNIITVVTKSKNSFRTKHVDINCNL